MICDLVNSLDRHAALVTALATVVLVGVTVFYAVKTASMARTMKEQHESSIELHLSELHLAVLEADRAEKEARDEAVVAQGGRLEAARARMTERMEHKRKLKELLEAAEKRRNRKSEAENA